MTDDGDLQDILADRERILMAAWALPNEGPLTDAQRKQAMGNFAAYLRANSITPAEVARQIGRPRATTIGDLMKGRYREHADEHIRKLNLWIEQHARAKAMALGDTFVTTTKVARDMLTVARLVRENGTMGLVYGPTGIGKSRCALAIHEKYVGSIYLCIMRDHHHAKGLTHALATKLGVRDARTATYQATHQTVVERVVATLRDTHRLILVDEAHKLTDSAIELCRELHDNTGVPFCLIATRDLHDRLLKTLDPDHGQVYSRFDVIHALTEGYDASAGGKILHSMEDIRALYQDPPIRLATDAQRYLQGVANDLGRGSLRRCKMLVRNAVRRARKRQGLSDGDKVTITAADLEWVDTHLRRERSEVEAVHDRQRRLATAASG